MIRGVSGLGKSYLIDCLKDNELYPIKVYSMLKITEQVQANGLFDLAIPSGKIYLDDVGTEEPSVKYFGTTVSFFKNFIETFYTNPYIFNKLIISTNNNFDEIEGKYGFRVRSRIKDIFNIVNVSGSDLRG